MMSQNRICFSNKKNLITILIGKMHQVSTQYSTGKIIVSSPFLYKCCSFNTFHCRWISNRIIQLYNEILQELQRKEREVVLG
jgi:hypothetical protein